MKSEQEAQEEEKQGQVKSEQEAREERVDAQGGARKKRRRNERCEFIARRKPRVEQTHDVVAERVVGPSQQRASHAHRQRAA